MVLDLLGRLTGDSELGGHLPQSHPCEVRVSRQFEQPLLDWMHA
jgi:hypothetical protein